MPKTLVITGGHHVSALELAKNLTASGWEIVWFGHRHSMWGDHSDSGEFKDVTAANIPFFDLQAGKLYHTLHPLKLIRIPWGFFQALFFLIRIKPQGIVSFGGYLAVPTVVAGWLLGIPSVTHEQTVTAGWANKFISFFVKKIAVSWSTSISHFPKSKTVLTGLPLRNQFLKPDNSKISKNQIYITGGKQGSHTINEVVFSALPSLILKYRIIHQTGFSSLYNDYQKAVALSKQYPNYTVFDFDSKKAVEALLHSGLVISRAGAHIVYELAILNKRCVLIPIPWSSHDEQLKNAMVLVNNRQAVVLPQDKLNPNSLVQAVSQASQLSSTPINLPTNAIEKLSSLINSTFT